jgi:hypothetical protein
VLVCETVALVAVGAFGISIGAFYQCILMTAAWTLVLYLLLVCRPYAHATAARWMLHAAQCLFLTSFVGLTFMPVGAVRLSTAYALAMGAVLLAVHVAIIGSVVVQLLFAVQRQRIGMVLQKWSQRWCPFLKHLVVVTSCPALQAAGGLALPAVLHTRTRRLPLQLQRSLDRHRMSILVSACPASTRALWSAVAMHVGCYRLPSLLRSPDDSC